jgi:hypothetical protein
MTANGAVYATSGTAATSTGALTSGQLLIGGTSTPAAATLTAGNNVTITNGNNSITVAAQDIFARKSADAVLAAGANNDLSLTIPANSTYEFSGVIIYNGNGNNETVTLDFTWPAGVTVRWNCDQGGTAQSPSSFTTTGTATGTFKVTNGSTADNLSIFVSGIIINGNGSSATFQLQETPNAAASISVLTNSFLRASRLQ